MQYRTLGRTGIKVSPYALGTMMFASSVGNPDHDDSIRIIHKALDAGINFVDTADAYGESEEIVGKALKGRRDDVVLATKARRPMGDDPNQQGASRRWIMTRGRELAAPPADRPHRPLPDPPAGPGHRHRGDALGAHRPGPQRQGPRHRLVHHCPPPTSSRPSGSPSGAAWSGSAPSSRPTRSSTAASSARCCPPPSATGWARWSGARSGRACSPAASARASRPTSRRAGFFKHLQRRAPARRRRAAHPARRGGRAADDPPGDGLRDRPPGRHQRAHRPRTMEHLDDLLAGVDVTLSDDDPRPDRRDRPARHRRRHARPGLRPAGPPGPEPAPPTRGERSAA